MKALARSKKCMACCVLALTVACSPSKPESSEALPGPRSVAAVAETADISTRLVSYTESREPCEDYSPNRVALFGDLHVHTSLSFDAAANSIGATPEDAYRYGMGEAIDFWPVVNGEPTGRFKIDRPLDFLAVTDHGEFLGERRLCREPDSPRYHSEFCHAARMNERQGMILFSQVITTETPARIPGVCGEDGALCREYAKGPWARINAAAEAAYDRSAKCSFTSLHGYEYTGTPGTSNYHRNVVFRNSNVPDLPVSYIDAPFDSQLWERLDEECTEERGCEYLTIPHNTNLANGRMAPYLRLDPTIENRRAYAAKRLQREPIMEIFQHKGASECINGLSSVLGAPDELCNVEAVRVMGEAKTYMTTRAVEGGGASDVRFGTATEITAECGGEVGANGMLGGGCVHATDFQRSGLLVGLEEEQEIGLNSVKLGVIASTDTHTATPGAVAEEDWRGHVSLESTPQERLQPGLLTSGIDGNPGGLAGVWAVENSRDAIFDAMQRREVFGSSGPRIAPRFFGGWTYPADLCDAKDLVSQGYADGVPMGGDLSSAPDPEAKPVFVAAAMRDPSPTGAPLQQLQLIKGWISMDGKRHNEVVSLAGGPNDAGVNGETGERFGAGHDSLCRVYRDEDFDSSQPTYYYIRVVENPSARWSEYDCRRIAEAERPAICGDGSYPATVQEMAWSSPIWYQP